MTFPFGKIQSHAGTGHYIATIEGYDNTGKTFLCINADVDLP